MAAPSTSLSKLIYTIPLSKGRMEALTDGIFAIAMTLLVLELKVTDAPKSISSSELLRLLGAQGTAFFSFGLSFLYCGLLWVMHHLAAHFFRYVQVGLAWFNLLFLMFISLLPFSCALLGHFLHNRAAQEIYFGNLFMAALMLAAQWFFAKKRRLLNEDDPLAARALERRIAALPVALIVGMIGAFFNVNAGFWGFLIAILALRLWERKRFSAQRTPAS